jgi:hypothetical protein
MDRYQANKIKNYSQIAPLHLTNFPNIGFDTTFIFGEKLVIQRNNCYRCIKNRYRVW